jgi:quercetin dioxygenase-like cupin family protein
MRHFIRSVAEPGVLRAWKPVDHLRSAAMNAVVSRPGEGERLDAEHLIKLALPELDVLEFTVGADYGGPGPHFHEHHVDAFFVLEGELEFKAGEETVRALPGTSVCVPPGVVHSFTTVEAKGARFLNVHAPGGFSGYLRARIGGDDPDPADFDIHDVETTGGPGEAIVATDGDGDRIEMPDSASTITIRADRPELSLLELAVEPSWSGVGLHHHDDHADTFFVLEGQALFLPEGRTVRVEAGTLVSAPIGVEHGIGRVDAPARFLNLHTPDGGFAGGVRAAAARRRAG